MEKKLIVVIGSLNVGGTERHLVSILPKLVECGWSVRVITLTEKGSLSSTVEAQGVEVISLLKPRHYKIIKQWSQPFARLLRIFLCVSRLAWKLKRESKDVLLHFYLPESYVLGMFGVMLSGFSGHTIMSRRSLNNYQTRRPGIAWFEKKLHPKTALIIGNSNAILTQLKEQEGVPDKHLRLIYNGVDLQAFSTVTSRDNIRKDLKIPLDAFVMIIVANLIPYKGHADLLRALARVKEALPTHWYLLCVGRDDGIGSSLKQQAEQLELTDRIQWLGSRRDVPDLLASADLGILCSHEEGFSNAILEAMASGLPMVVTDVGGNAEAVLNGQTGYVVPAKDEQALSKAILELAKDPKKSLSFGQAGRLRVVEKFSLKYCVISYLALYDTLLNERNQQDTTREIKSCVD